MMKNSPDLHVLIVDDEPLIRWSMAETLSHVGYEVSEAGDAKETLEQIAKGRTPDVVLLDYRLPDSDDLNLLQTIRETIPQSPVIMMTAFGTPAVLDGALKLGAFCVLSKPLEMRDLPDLVERACAARVY